MYKVNLLVKKAVILVSLVEESSEKTNADLEKDIFHAVSKRPVIPWVAKVEKVQVTEE